MYLKLPSTCSSWVSTGCSEGGKEDGPSLGNMESRRSLTMPETEEGRKRETERERVRKTGKEWKGAHAPIDH